MLSLEMAGLASGEGGNEAMAAIAAALMLPGASTQSSSRGRGTRRADHSTFSSNGVTGIPVLS